jgi:hypothetical protein
VVVGIAWYVAVALSWIVPDRRIGRAVRGPGFPD